MSKYAALEVHLRESGQDSVTMTFAEIERVIGADLPPSAFKHRPWWSNNPSNSVITHSWLKAGYKSENVDMAGKTLDFVKTAQYPPAGETGSHVLRDAAPPAAASFSLVFGALKGMVTIKEGTDLTAPVEADWEAAG